MTITYKTIVITTQSAGKPYIREHGAVRFFASVAAAKRHITATIDGAY